MSGDGKNLFSASDDYTLKQWDLATGRCQREWYLSGNERVYLCGNREFLDHSPEAWRIAHGVERDPETQEFRPFSLEYLKKD